MINSVIIYGAGSIGNHLAHASRRKGWKVTVVDIDDDALRRTQLSIYPSRYGEWDKSIELRNVSELGAEQYDLVVVGTPPDLHLKIASEALRHQPCAILIEKPASALDLAGADELVKRAGELGVRLFIGYDHIVSKSVQHLSKLLEQSGSIIETIDTEFREHWGGIFAAHPWLAGPWESYLGYSERGGGALAEHSHALNLWQYFANVTGAGRIVEVQALTSMVRNNGMEYDKISLLNIKTERGVIGRCLQDVITSPPRKWVGLKFSDIQYNLKFSPAQDILSSSENVSDHIFKKSRPDDFYAELNHIDTCLKNNSGSPIDFINGLETMLVIKAAHLSAHTHQSVFIDYNKGFNESALTVGIADAR